jgi:hypothetical protein
MIFSSSVENGALNKSNNNDEFSVQFTSPIFIGENASNARLEVISAQIWNNSPNITSTNNKIVIRDVNGDHEIYVDQGLYDYTSLFQQIALQYDNKATNPAPYWRFEDVFRWDGNYSTQKLSIIYLYTNDAKINQLQIIWNESTITSLLGY